MTKTFRPAIFFCQPKEIALIQYIFHRDLADEANYFGRLVFIIRRIFFLPGNSSCFSISVISLVGLSMMFANRKSHTLR